MPTNWMTAARSPRILWTLPVALVAVGLHGRTQADDFCFSPTPYAVGDAPYDVTLSDLNNDGLRDLVVANHSAELDNRVSVLINNGDGTFAPSVFYEVGDRPYWLASTDLNGDGWMDIVVTNYFGASISVLMNAGGGVFLPHTEYATGNGPTFIAVGFIDANSSPDVVVANAFEYTISIFLNNGDGTLAPHVTYPVGALPYGVDVADLNADGSTDVAVSNYGSGEVNTDISVLLNNGDGTLAPAATYLAGIAAVGIVAVDLDNDGAPELATANLGFLAENNTVSVLHNNGDGTFAPHVEYVVGVGPYDITTADFDADGFLDLTTGNEEGSVSILLNNGDGTFASASSSTVAPGALGIGTGDLDGNGTPEIATVCYTTNEVWVLFNQNAGLVSQPTSLDVPVGGSAAFTVAAVGLEPFTYQWRRDGIDLADGGAVSGATTSTLTIDPVSARDAGSYDVVVTNDCGVIVSEPASLTIASPPCPADLNLDGSVDAADLAILLGGWGQPGVGDIDASGAADAVDLGLLLGSWGAC
jgi:FG-GAP-like repeat/Immunoglobulin I-set domain